MPTDKTYLDNIDRVNKADRNDSSGTSHTNLGKEARSTFGGGGREGFVSLAHGVHRDSKVEWSLVVVHKKKKGVIVMGEDFLDEKLTSHGDD